MSREEYLNAYRRDQDAVFSEIRFKEGLKRIEEAVSARMEERKTTQAREEKLRALKLQLWQLGSAAGMSFPEYIKWAEEIVQRCREAGLM